MLRLRTCIYEKDIIKIPIGKDAKDGYAIVDRDRLDLTKYNWHITTKGYVSTSPKYGESYLLHRLVMNAPEGMLVDHIDHNVLDNRSINLRLCTPMENSRNSKSRNSSSSKYIGVGWHRAANKWEAFGKLGKKVYLGIYVNEIDAAKAYDKFALENYGDFANTNFQDGEYTPSGN